MHREALGKVLSAACLKYCMGFSFLAYNEYHFNFCNILLSSQITVYKIDEKNNLDLDLAILSALLKGKA